MRLLLVAYDFPPNPSPQSLRWAYLVRELVALGYEITVITADLPGYGPGGLPEIPDEVRVRRVYPGPLSALIHMRERGHPRDGSDCADSDPDTENQAPLGGRQVGISPTSPLNWKGRVAESFKRVLSLILFPDYRAEWLPWARRALREVLSEFKPDIVVTSHEPACSLALGLEASRLGFRWVADLGDPILAPYTPLRWRSRARRLERAVCSDAAMVSVTSESFAKLLSQRHGLDPTRCMVLPQGFDANVQDDSQFADIFDPAVLELLYTGRFYVFRRAEALLAAVIAVEGVRLTIATPNAPDYVTQAAEAHPDKVRLLGFLTHRLALQLQRRCDIVVNLANEDPVQVPGKVNEYLGSGRPILHISKTNPDATGRLIDSLHAGWHVGRCRAEIQTLLQGISERHALGPVRLDGRDIQAIAAYSWQHLAAGWDRRVQTIP